MYVAEFDDLSLLADGVTRHLAYGKADDLDVVSSTDTQTHNVMLTAESCAFDAFDLKDVWLTKARWGAFTRQYVNSAALDTWLGLVADKQQPGERGVSFMRTEAIEARRNATIDRVWRRWGSCILGFGYRSLPRPQLTMHSRTSYVGYMGEVDLALAAVLAREVAEVVGLLPQDIAFTWHLEAAQFHGFKTLCWFLKSEGDRRKLMAVSAKDPRLSKYPTLRLARKNLENFERMDAEGVLYSDMKFAQLLRLRQRYHTEVHGYEYGAQFEGGPERRGYRGGRYKPLPTIGVDALDLSAVRRKGGTEDDELMAGRLDEVDE